MNKEKIQTEYPDFCAEIENLAEEYLRERIVKMQQELQESEEHKESNEALAEARAAVKELSGPYRDVKKAVKAKTAYIIEILKARGKV